jgi:hypothetical protein
MPASIKPSHKHYTVNAHCVHVETDCRGGNFMHVYEPLDVSITITADGQVAVNVNDSCVFTIRNPANIRVANQLREVNPIPGD